MQSRLISRAAVLVVMMAGLVPAPIGGDAKKDDEDRPLWTHGEFHTFGVERIGMLPVCTFDNSIETERRVQAAISAALKETGFRWLSATATRALIRTGESGDTKLTALRDEVLEHGRLSPATASRMCAELRCDALLTVRVDRWEKNDLEWNQSGKPSTTVGLRAALVDSSGVLLWRASGTHTGEGLYRQARGDVVGVKGSGLGRKPVTGQGGAPEYSEVMDRLLSDWPQSFPRPASADSTAPASPSSKS